MAMVIVNNMSAVRTLNLLNANQSNLTKVLQKVSSGQRINSAGDDASGYAISERMRVQIRAMQQDSRNVRNGRFLLQTALGGLEQIKSSLEKMAMLADQASNGLLTDFDRAVVAVGSDLAASALITMNLKALGVGYIVCKAHDDTYREILEKLGADRVIIPEWEAADKLALGLTHSGVMEYIELSEEYGLYRQDYCGCRYSRDERDRKKAARI